MDARCLAIHTGDREAEGGVMGEPDEVALRVEGDISTCESCIKRTS